MTDRIDALLRRIDLEGARHRLDRALRTARRLGPTGRVLLPRDDDDTSVVEVLLAGLSDDERDAVLDELTYEEVLDRVLEKGWRGEVTCESASCLTSWGFGSFELGPRGYFFEVRDSDEEPECPCRLLGAWEPVAARAAYEAAWVEVYVTWWGDIGLPGEPHFGGDFADGPRPLMLRALERILGKDDAVWAAAIRERVLDLPGLELGDLIESTANRTGLPPGTVEAVLRETVEGAAAEAPPELRRRILREAYLNMW